jgi:hypothetical protein
MFKVTKFKQLQNLFKITKFNQLQNLIEQLGSIAADQGTYSTHSYTSSTGSYTRIKWKYKKLLFSTEYPNSHKDKSGLHNAYVTTRKSLNLIGLSVDDMSSLSKDYMEKTLLYQKSFMTSGNILNRKEPGYLVGLSKHELNMTIILLLW